MSNTITKITTMEAVCIIIACTVNKLILNLPEYFLLSCGSSCLINILILSLIAIFFSCLLAKLFKNFSNSDIVDISEFLGGRTLKIIVSIMIIFYLASFASLIIRDFSEMIHNIYYYETNVIYLLIFFIITTCISNLLGEKAIFKSNVFIVLLMIASLIITFTSVFPNIVWQRIFPILGYGAFETFIGGLSNIFAFNALTFLYFIMPVLAEKKNFKTVAITSSVIISILLFLSVACLLFSLSFSTSIKDISCIYTVITNNDFGTFIQHPESLFIFVCIIANMTFLNLVVLFITRFSQKLTKIKNAKLLIIVICILLFGISMIPQNMLQARRLEEYLYKFVSIPLMLIIFPIILILANIKFKRSHLPDKKED